MLFKDISYLEPFAQRRGTIRATLIKYIMRHNSMIFFKIWAIGSGDVVKYISYLELWGPLFGGAEPFVQFW